MRPPPGYADDPSVKALRPSFLLAALASVALLAGCGGAPEPLDPLALAAETTADAGSARFEMEIEVAAQGQTFAATAAGAVDNATQRLAMSMDLSSLGQAFGAPAGSSAGDLSMDMILDGTVAYMRFPLLTRLVANGKPWLKLDLVELAKRGDFDLGQLQSLSDNDPRRTLDYLRAVAGEIRTVGSETVRGVPTTHYRAAVNLREYPELVPGDQREAVQQAVDRIIAQTGIGAVPVEVWVDDEQRVRRMAIELAAGSGAVPVASKVTMELFDYGVPVVVTAPPEAEVADLAALLPGS
jgi:hypothetical protein